jgi:hypothetical protein
MGKDIHFSGEPVFAQLIKLLPFDDIKSIANELGSDRYIKKFCTVQHLITMLYGVTSGCTSLREVVSGIVSYGDKISHCKLNYATNKSTLSDANKRRDHKVFEKIYNKLVSNLTPFLSDTQTARFKSKYKLFAIDSTTISLFQPIFECVGRLPNDGKRKGGIKSHQKLDIQSGIPVTIWHSDAKQHDSVFIHREGVMKPNEVAVMDKAYNNYSAFAKWSKSNIYFVTRLKDNAKETLVRELDLSDSPDEIMRDAIVKLEFQNDENEKESVELRLVSYYDKENQRAFYFLTNMFDATAEEIALIYKMRWQIELLFKKIKQNFPLTYFYGDNQNAIQIQIWCTLIACLLLTQVQQKVTKQWSFSNLVSIVQKHLFSYVKLLDFLNSMHLYAKEFCKSNVKIAQQAYQTELKFET